MVTNFSFDHMTGENRELDKVLLILPELDHLIARVLKLEDEKKYDRMSSLHAGRLE